MSALTGRTAVRARVDAMPPPPPSPGIDAAAHVICVMGGHIPNRDTERPGACDFHRIQASLALEQASLASDL